MVRQVIAVSTDGFDGDADTTFTTAEDSAEKEIKDRRADVKYIRKAFPHTTFRKISGVGHGGLAPFNPERFVRGIENVCGKELTMRSDKEYKELTIREFSKAADIYETDQAGIYEICKEDYPYISSELKKEDFNDLLDCGCGTGPMISLLYEKDPSKHYTGLDITPRMIETAKAKNLEGVKWVVGDCENLPFGEDSFDAVICSNSFHHYPNPQAFFNSVKKVLRPGGRLILQDYTASKPLLWLMNHTEMPLANLVGHGDVKAYSLDEIREFCKRAELKIEKLEKGRKFRLHLVARKGV